MITKQSFWNPPFQAFSPLLISNIGDAKKKDHCKTKYPDMVKDYNQSMSRVDVNDMLISL